MEAVLAYGLAFLRDGAERMRGVVGEDDLKGVEAAIAACRPGRAGVRLHGIPGLKPFLAAAGSIGIIAASVLGVECRPVRAILFDKTAAANWSLGWHQDRTIAVKERIDVAGFGPWTCKSGLTHVEPPFSLLEGMLTLRVHLDPVPKTNAPLLIARGSHQFGRIPISKISAVVQRCGTAVCVADRGDVWIYATPILHASNAAADPSRRRVLQIDFAVGELPGGLQWLGV